MNDKTLLTLGLLAALSLCGCGRADPQAAEPSNGVTGAAPPTSQSPSPSSEIEALAGRYAPGGVLVDLDLRADGAYEALIFGGGMGPSGCATVEGNGMSRGTWSVDGTTLVFRVLDETGLVVGLAKALQNSDGTSRWIERGGTRYELAVE